MMMPKTIQAYVALLCADGTEPDARSGYARVPIEFGYDQSADFFMSDQIEFPDVLPPGYRPVTAFAVFDQPKDGEPLIVWQLPQSVQVNVGEVPVIHHGKLLRGVAVQAKIVSASLDGCNLMGFGGKL